MIDQPSAMRERFRHTCCDPACELIEQYCAACEDLSLREWVRERYENCIRLAEGKSGTDRDGWLNDAEYFRQISQALSGKAAQIPDEKIEEMARRIAELQHMGVERGLELRQHKIAEILREGLGGRQ